MMRARTPLSVREPWSSQRLAQQTPHSVFIAAAALLLAVTVVLDLIVQPELLGAFWMWLIIAFCLAASSAALGFGSRVPIWVGLVSVTAFALASVYFVSPWATHQSAVSTLQELPLVALYLGWFVRRAFGWVLFSAVMLLIIVMMVLNPVFAPGGALGPSVALAGTVIAVLCYGVGVMLWSRLDRKIRTDALTGLLNRRGFLDSLESEVARAQRQGQPMVLVVIDFDGLKRINDTLGHGAGDAVLRETARYWRRVIRGRDLIGRTGGDEFAMVLDRVGAQQAQRVMERFRSGSPHAWSWGVAEVQSGDTIERLFRRADAALYTAKEAGR